MSWFPQVGDLVGRFRLTGVLGHGGMGVVFAAVGDDLDRTVALKVLAPHVSDDPRLRARFRREAETLARLDSPHVVHVLEYGEHDGCAYLVTQHVPDGDLRRRLQESGPLPPRRAVGLVGQVAAALEEAHAHGVVHRDLKAANVLLKDLPDGELHAYLCDFGIARAEDDETTTSGVVGTLEYLAPERQGGAPASVATDVYALGCLLWATLTGTPPYRGSDVEVAVAHLRAPVVQLATDGPGSRRINAVLRRALAKDPRRRYPSAAAMRQELLRLVDLLPSAPVAPGGSSGRWRPRRRALVPAGAVLVAAVAAGLWFGGPAVQQSGGARLPAPQRPGAEQSPQPQDSRPARCWDGKVVDATDACSTPEGLDGLRWVYPSFKADQPECRRIRDPLAELKVTGYFCPFTTANPREGIRYSEWTTAAAARRIISRDFSPWPEQDVELDGHTMSVWVRESRDEVGWFSSAVAYRDWPFTAEAVSNTPRAAKLACNLVTLRSPGTFEPVQSLCVPGLT